MRTTLCDLAKKVECILKMQVLNLPGFAKETETAYDSLQMWLNSNTVKPKSLELDFLALRTLGKGGIFGPGPKILLYFCPDLSS